MATDSVLKYSSGAVPRIAALDLANEGGPFILISLNDILFAFMESSLSQKFIQSHWREQKVLKRRRVFIRTPRGVFRTRFRSVRELERSLDSRPFLRIQPALLVNVLRITQLDAAGRLNQVAVAPLDGPIEWLSVSRRSLRILRGMVGLSPRAVSSGRSKKPQVAGSRRRLTGKRAASRRGGVRSVRRAR